MVDQDTRLFFTWTFWRVTTPFREVSFADFLLADVLTSLAKALSDCERALCHLSTGPVMQPHDTDEVTICLTGDTCLWKSKCDRIKDNILNEAQKRRHLLSLLEVSETWMKVSDMCSV